jgi:hypothetical protein
MAQMRNAYKILVGKAEVKRPLGKRGRRWEDNIRKGLRERGWEGVEWRHLAQDRGQWRTFVNMKLTFGFHKRKGIS